jgi:RES domain-containing protein
VRVWRLALGSYPALDGEGARLFGGRWNSPGTPVVYAATHVALALLEQLVHVSPERLPAGLRAFAIDLPDDALVENGRSDEPDGVEAARRYGDAWAASLRSAALVVPSMIVPAMMGSLRTDERNVILNPRHGSAVAWRMTETPFKIDPRLRRRA